jgi:hypothetical protein
MVALRSLALSGGLDCPAYGALYADTFGEGFDGYCNASTTVRGAALRCAGAGPGPHGRRVLGRGKGLPASWHTFSLASLSLQQGFLRNWSRGQRPPQSGAEDAQADCVARLAPLVAAFGGARLRSAFLGAGMASQCLSAARRASPPAIVLALTRPFSPLQATLT